MKKILLRILLILLALLVIYTIFNQFDIGKSSAKFTLLNDIPKANFEKNNGFYILWALSEPLDIDISSNKIINKYRKLFDPKYDIDKNIYDFNVEKYNHKPRKNTWLEKYRIIGINFPIGINKDRSKYILSIKNKLLPIDPYLKIFLERYTKMLNTKVFQDFTALRNDAPLPNLLAWLHASKLYTAVNMLTALEGNWEKGVSNILDQLDFSKRAVKGSRVLITNLISKAIMQISLQSISSLMNQKECPIDIFEMVLKRMPTLKYEEFGTRTSFMCEHLGYISNYIEKGVYKDKNISLFKRLLLKLFMQKNRTKKYFLDFFEKYIKIEETLPYKWESDQKEEKALNSGLFWWLQNPAGKVFFNYNNTNLKTVIFKSYAKKAMYDIVKISAELHLNYTPETPVQEILNRLNTYKNNIDPCSGKPYIWNEQKQILYSIGTDRKDNQGQTNNYTKIENTDFAFPVILYVRID